MNKTWTVTFERRETYTYEVIGKDYDDAFQNAISEIDNQVPIECNSEYYLEESDDDN